MKKKMEAGILLLLVLIDCSVVESETTGDQSVSPSDGGYCIPCDRPKINPFWWRTSQETGSTRINQDRQISLF